MKPDEAPDAHDLSVRLSMPTPADKQRLRVAAALASLTMAEYARRAVLEKITTDLASFGAPVIAVDESPRREVKPAKKSRALARA